MTSHRRQSAIALVCAVLAVVAVFAYTASVRAQAATARDDAIAAYGGERASVLVATQDIPVGTALTSENTAEQEWLVDLLPQEEVVLTLEDVAGQVAQVDIVANEPVLASRVGNGTSRISVPSGLTAVTVSSDDVLAVGGAITAGSFVDVYVETSTGGVELLGEQILVLETSDEDDLTWVTLAITPESVSELIYAATQGTIHLALPSETGVSDDSSSDEAQGDTAEEDE